MYSFLFVLKNFYGRPSLWKTSWELVLKEKWRTDILYDKRYSEFDGSFKKQTLQGKVYIREPSIES